MMQFTQSQVDFPERNVDDWYSRTGTLLGHGAFGRVFEAYDDRELLLRMQNNVTTPLSETPFNVQAWGGEDALHKLETLKSPEVDTLDSLRDWVEVAIYLAQFSYDQLLDLWFVVKPLKPDATSAEELAYEDQIPMSRLALILGLVQDWTGKRPFQPQLITLRVMENHFSVTTRPMVVIKEMAQLTYRPDDEDWEKREKELQRVTMTEVFTLAQVSSQTPLYIGGYMSDPVGCVDMYGISLINCMLDYFYVKQPPAYFIVLSMTRGPDLFNLLLQYKQPPLKAPEMLKLIYAGLKRPRLPGMFLWFLTWSMAWALHKAHIRGVIHNDMKPENIMYDPEAGALTLIDFGLACTTVQGQTRPGKLDWCDKLGGTMSYANVEQLRDRRRYPVSDVWALGVTLWEVAMGKSYLPDYTNKQIEVLVLSGHKPDVSELNQMDYSGLFEIPEKQRLLDLLDEMLQVDARDRPSTVQIIRYIHDTFRPGRELTKASVDQVGKSLQEWSKEAMDATKPPPKPEENPTRVQPVPSEVDPAIFSPPRRTGKRSRPARRSSQISVVESSV